MSSVKMVIARAIDLAHATRAERGDSLVGAGSCAGSEGHDAPGEVETLIVVERALILTGRNRRDSPLWDETHTGQRPSSRANLCE
jgi:hypothetical protein